MRGAGPEAFQPAGVPWRENVLPGKVFRNKKSDRHELYCVMCLRLTQSMHL